MELLVIKIFTCIILIAVFAALYLEWVTFSEYRKLKRILRDGRQFEAVILDVRPINPTILNMENVKLKIQLLTDKPVVTEFRYDASYPEWRELSIGKIITVDIDPSDHTAALITRKSVISFWSIGPAHTQVLMSA